MNKWLIELLIRALAFLSPEIRAALVAFVTEMEGKAKQTSNPWDDVFVFLLKTILGL